MYISEHNYWLELMIVIVIHTQSSNTAPTVRVLANLSCYRYLLYYYSLDSGSLAGSNFRIVLVQLLAD